MATDETKEIENRIEEVSASNKAILKKRNRIDYVLFGGLGVFYILLAVVSAVAGNWELFALHILLLLWLGWILILNLQLNHQRFVIDMQFDLRRLERDELQTLLNELEANADKALAAAEELAKTKKAKK